MKEAGRALAHVDRDMWVGSCGAVGLAWHSVWPPVALQFQLSRAVRRAPPLPFFFFPHRVATTARPAACTTTMTHLSLTMESSTDSSVDDLAARATVKNYGDIRYVMPRDGSPTSGQLPALTPASVGQYYHDPRPRDTFRVRANCSFQESRVRASTDLDNSGESG